MKFAAKRMGATTVEMKSSHVPMLSHPKQVLDVIRTAAAAVQRSAARQGASTTPTAWPKLTQSLTQWDLWRGGIAKRIKWLRLTAKHLKSVTRKGVWVRLPLPALVIPATYGEVVARDRAACPRTCPRNA